MPEVHVTVNTQAELRRKIEAFGELFGPPRGKSFIALMGGEDIWTDISLMSFGRAKVQIHVDGKLELVNIDWSQNQKP